MTLGETARIQEGERHSRRDVRPETYGREETGGTGCSTTWKELMTRYPERW